MNPDGPPTADDAIMPAAPARRGAAPLSYGARFRRLVLRLLAIAATFFLVFTVLTATAAWYTSRSEFCDSCHNMEPYYASWERSAHHDVKCVECHITPGFGGKIRGKMQGLVQLTKYVTKTEGPRPHAQIPDLTCMRAGCHEQRLLTGRVDFRGLSFDHKPHIADEGSRGLHLRCTSCHSQPTMEEHMSVDLDTCYLCHFKNEPFNDGLGACNRCHQVPEKTYDLGGGTQFTHELAFTTGVDCASCHRDLIRGDGQVREERCRACHTDKESLAKIGERDMLHVRHTEIHRIDCVGCHEPIAHSLDDQRLTHAVSDCASCHPNHHQEQLQMFEGVGGELAPGAAGGMTASRVACRSCHQVLDVSPTGTMLWKSSADVCSMCHDAAQVSDLLIYQDALGKSLLDIEAALGRAQQARDQAELTDERRTEFDGRLTKLRHDAEFLRIGKGIHNVHYADKLQRVLFDETVKLCGALQVEPPTVAMPEQQPEWKALSPASNPTPEAVRPAAEDGEASSSSG